MGKDETKPKTTPELEKYLWARGEELKPDIYPSLGTLSAAFIWQFLPHPRETSRQEYVYISVDDIYNQKRLANQGKNTGDDEIIKQLLFLTEWNWAWEVGQLRYELFSGIGEVPKNLRWLKKYRGKNLYLLPQLRTKRCDTYASLFHLIPRKILERFKLPPLRRGLWPYNFHDHSHLMALPNDFDERLSRAFAHHIWPLINSGSPLAAFSANDPIRLLTHNLDFWLPYAYQIIEERAKAYGYVRIESKKQKEHLEKLREKIPNHIIPARPYKGGLIWMGEDDAWEITREIIGAADQGGRLRGIIEAVRTHRIEDDFSAIWSNAKEDFERKLYKKRSKIKVTFVELDDTQPIQGPEAEIHENLVWEDLLSLVNIKDRRIVVLLQNGYTKVGEISKTLGYANHSPVSKALARIRKIAKKYFE